MNNLINLPKEEIVSNLVIKSYDNPTVYVTLKLPNSFMVIHQIGIARTFEYVEDFNEWLNVMNVESITKYPKDTPLELLLSNKDKENLYKETLLVRVNKSCLPFPCDTPKFFLKKDLRAGMLVEFNDGRVGVVINDYIAMKDTYICSGAIGEDLVISKMPYYAIVKIYEPKKCLTINELLDKSFYTEIRTSVSRHEALCSYYKTKYLVIVE